jgi:hypothetical protein
MRQYPEYRVTYSNSLPVNDVQTGNIIILQSNKRFNWTEFLQSTNQKSTFIATLAVFGTWLKVEIWFL